MTPSEWLLENAEQIQRLQTDAERAAVEADAALSRRELTRGWALRRREGELRDAADQIRAIPYGGHYV